MCKRTVERLYNCPKRFKPAPQYTHGPLDENFGQHSAFPLDPSQENDEVYEYLRLVRLEAENDQVVHFVNKRATEPVRMVRKQFSELSAEYVQLVIERLKEQKRKERGDVGEFDEIDVGEIDFDEIDVGDIDVGDIGVGDIDVGEAAVDHAMESPQINPSEVVESETKSPKKPDFTIPQSATEWRSLVFSQGPPPHFHDALEHPTVIKLVVYYTKWLLVSMPQSLSEWIFATFVRLDEGLDHTEMALVRDLGKKARKLRNKFRSGVLAGAEVPQLPQEVVNMVLAVVGQYYGQRDLLIDEEIDLGEN